MFFYRTLDPSNTLRPCRALTYVEVTEDVDSGPREGRLAVAGGVPHAGQVRLFA